MRKENRPLKVLFATLIAFLTVLPNVTIGQHYFRMTAEFSIKEKFSDGKMSLTKGNVYYDRNYRKLVYNVKFPEKEAWVIMDTVFNKVVNKQLVMRAFIPLLPSATLFDFALSSSLDNFGLEKSFYTVTKVERDGDLVISTWTPDKRMAKAMGKILISKKNNKLYGVAFYSPKDELLKKQIFKNYLKAGGVEFPAEITEIIYKISKNGVVTKEMKISTFKNLKVNDLKEDEIYNFPVPAAVKK